jgi:hypothetical protein
MKAAGPQHKGDGLWVPRETRTAAVVPPGGVAEGTADPRGGETKTDDSGGSVWAWVVGALVVLGGGAAGAAAWRRQRRARGNADTEPTRHYAPVPGHPGRRRYGQLRAFEATGTIDDHDGRGPHTDLFRHDFDPRSAPSLDFDAAKRLHFSGGRYTVTAHGVEDRPRANTRHTPMWMSYGSKRGTVASSALGAGAVFGAVVLGVGVRVGAQLGLNYALRPAEGATAETIRKRVMLREILLGTGLTLLTVGSVAMGRTFPAIVFGVGAVEVVGRNVLRTDAGQKLLQKMGEYMTRSRLPTAPPPAGTGAVDDYGNPLTLSAGAFSDSVRKLQAVGS